MSNELIQKAAEALDIALGRIGVFNPPELDFMCAAYDGLVAALQPSLPQKISAPIVWARPEDIRKTMIAVIGERAEVAPDREPGFTVPLYLHPAVTKPSLPQDVEEWIADRPTYDDGSHYISERDLRAFLAGKVLVPAAEMRKQIIDCLLSTSGLSDGATADAIVSMLTASKGE